MDPLYPVASYEPQDSSSEMKAGESLTYAKCPGRIAIYDSVAGAAPRVIEIEPGPTAEFLDLLSVKTHEAAGGVGGTIPFTVIREIVENFIHAGFNEPVISIFDEGQTIRFSDQGPGIEDKDKAVLPGFTSATQDMKVYIRGVGSGLPIVGDFLSINGGSFVIEDNVGKGTVVTITTKRSPAFPSLPQHGYLKEAAETSSQRPVNLVPKEPTSRQIKILALLVEGISAGPSFVAEKLDISVATAHRDLEFLEERGFVITREDRKRVLTDEGYACLNRRLL